MFRYSHTYLFVTEVQQKATMKKCSLLPGKYFPSFLIYSYNKQYLERLWIVDLRSWGKNSYSIFWLQAEGMNENCNCKCFPMELLQELCSISPPLQLRNPTERKTDEISRGSRLLQALNSPKPCKGYQERERLELDNSSTEET